MKYGLISLASLAIVVALGMMWDTNKDSANKKGDPTLRIIAIVGLVGFLILAFALGGDSSDE